MSTTTLPTATPLTAADRCDSCPAQAFKRVVFDSGSDLILCDHHYRAHASAIQKMEGVKTYNFDGVRVIHDVSELLDDGIVA